VLHIAASRGHLELLQWLLASAGGPQWLAYAAPEGGWDPLLVAAHAGQLDAVRWLLQQRRETGDGAQSTPRQSTQPRHPPPSPPPLPPLLPRSSSAVSSLAPQALRVLAQEGGV